MLPELLTLILPLVALILLGAFAGQSDKLARSGREVVDWLLVRFALPAFLFSAAASASFDELFRLPYFLTVAFGIYCAFAVAFTVAALLNRGDIEAATITGTLGARGRIAQLGPALVIPAFGSAAALPLAIYYLADAIVIRLMLPAMHAIGGKEQRSMRQIAEGVARSFGYNPPVIAVLLGCLWSATGLRLPAPIESAVDFLGSAAAPLGLIGLGLALARMKWRGAGGPKWSNAVPVKLIIHPLIVYLLLGWVGDFDPVWTFTAMFLSALPSAASVINAEGRALSSDSLQRASAASIVLSVLTITLLVGLTVGGAIAGDPFPSG